MFELTRQRELRGLSKRKLAQLADLHPSRLSVIEHAKAVAYSGELRRLAGALGWTGDPAALMNEVDGAPPA